MKIIGKKNYIHFINDPRKGGPHKYADNFNYVTKKIIKNQIIIPNSNQFIKLFFYRDIHRFFYIYEIIINFIVLIYTNLFTLRFKKIDTFNIHGFYNLAPLIFALITNKKINWFIHEEIPKKFIFLFNILPIKFNTIFVYNYRKLKIKNKSNFLIIKPSINIKFWNNKKKIIKKNNTVKKIVAVGNINKTKNFLFLLESLQQFKKAINLTIVGENLKSQYSYFKKLKKLSQILNKKNFCKITLAGRLSSIKVKNLLINSDLFVTTSLSEGTPFSLLEAMSCGKICIAPNITNLSFIKNGYNGFKYISNNEKSFQKILLKSFAINKNLKGFICKNAINYIKKEHNILIFQKKIKTKLLLINEKYSRN